MGIQDPDNHCSFDEFSKYLKSYNKLEVLSIKIGQYDVLTVLDAFKNNWLNLNELNLHIAEG